MDGFSGGQLPAKESIREIRINQNPFSPEYDKLGYGRNGRKKVDGFRLPDSDADFLRANPVSDLAFSL